MIQTTITQDVQKIPAAALLPNDLKGPNSSTLKTNRNFAIHFKDQWIKPITTLKCEYCIILNQFWTLCHYE